MTFNNSFHVNLEQMHSPLW